MSVTAFKLPAIPMFAQLFVHAFIIEKSKALRYWPFVGGGGGGGGGGESISYRWFPSQRASSTENALYLGVIMISWPSVGKILTAQRHRTETVSFRYEEKTIICEQVNGKKSFLVLNEHDIFFAFEVVLHDKNHLIKLIKSGFLQSPC